MHKFRYWKPITRFSVPYLFLSVGISLAATIWSVYLNSFLNNSSLVGFLTSFFTVIEVLAYLFLIPLIQRGNKMKLLITSLLFFTASYFLFSVYSNIYLVLALGVIIAIASSLRTTLVGLIVRDSSNPDEVSRNEGVIYSLLNSAWFAGPLVSGYLANLYGFGSVFFLSSVLILLSIFLFHFLRVKDDKKSKQADKNIPQIISDFFRKKNLRLIYVLSMSITFWWTFIYVFMPLYIINAGLSEVVLGLFISGVTIPLIFGDYIFARLAGRTGFKKLFFTGFFTLGILAISLFFIQNVYIVLGLLILASVSMSMLEPTTEAYFMDSLKENERDRYYSVYATAIHIGALASSLPAAALLAFLPFKFLFLFAGMPMIILAFLALKIKDFYEFRKKEK
ncbi:MAG: MFS transporter [Candidatus Nanoarchaeia archaeon]|nr:MFS transporter [Candidatus Nanoarchaeia archaeon]